MKKFSVSSLLVVMGVVVVGTGLTGCKVDRVAQKEAAETAKIVNDPVRDVSTSSVEVKNVSEFLEVNGEIATSTDSQVSATTGGKIVSVFVREGDLVSAGQIVAQLDTENLQQQAAQARASLASARAQYSQASSNAQLAPGRTSAAVKQAEAALRSAKSQLQKALNGARDEDRDQANNNLRAAKSNLDTSKKQLDRVKTLVKEGALPESQLDTAKNAYEAALAQYENALVAVSVTKNASRPEDIESARENVRQAEQALESAKTTKNLDVILKDQVEAAKAQIKSAEAQVQVAEKNLRESAVNSGCENSER
ncbi:MAG: biotin/lipoyl-binding protein [Fimbriimonadaceae bacterium]|nr:biotin/lipoyl-binding protein [Fimbriimonadaceae bacterium]